MRTPTREPRDRTTRRRGFTLVEVVVSMGVLVAGILGLGSALVLSVRSSEVSAQRAAALVAATAQLESLLASAATEGEDVRAAPRTFPVAGLAPIPPAADPGTVAVTTCEGQLVRISVAVEWRGALGPDAVRLSTMANLEAGQ